MISFDRVSKRYANGREALTNVSFNIHNGEMVFLTGRSGAGKSTVLKLIALLERPTRGSVVVHGRNTRTLKGRHIAAFRRRIGVVFQDHRLLADRPVFDNVALPLAVAATPLKEIDKRVRAALDQVGLLGAYALVDFLQRRCGHGQRQRDVVEHRPVGEQPVVLEHHADAAPERRDMPPFEGAGVAAVHHHVATRGALEQRDELEHRALAGAGAAGEKHHLAVVDVEADVGERLAPAGVAFAHPVETDHAVPAAWPAAAEPACGPSTSAAAKAAASNSPKSSALSPTPMKRIGIRSWCAMAITMPPLAVPSSLVSTSPVTPTAWRNCCAWASAFCPWLASSTSSTSWGAVGSTRWITRLTFFSSSIRCDWLCTRPAVSASMTSIPRARAACKASKTTAPGSAPGSCAANDAPERCAHTSSCSIAAARKVSPAASTTLKPSSAQRRASLPMVVVLPEPLTPTTRITNGR